MFTARTVNIQRVSYVQLTQARYKFAIKYKPRKDVDKTKIPYQIKRSASGNLPVFFETGIYYRYTIIRHVAGNPEVLQKELEQILQLKCRVSKATYGHTLRIPGNHETKVKDWLHHHGF